MFEQVRRKGQDGGRGTGVFSRDQVQRPPKAEARLVDDGQQAMLDFERDRVARDKAQAQASRHYPLDRLAARQFHGLGRGDTLLRKPGRVPALKTDRGGVERIPLGSFKDDLKRKGSLRKMMIPDKTGKDEKPEPKKASESVRAFEEAYG